MDSVASRSVFFMLLLVVLGPQKLPERARCLGKLMAEFRKASTDFKSAFEEEMREMERQTLQAERKKAADAAAASAAASETGAAPDTEPSPSSQALLSESSGETHGSADPLISPVAESVPRSSQESVHSTPER